MKRPNRIKFKIAASLLIGAFMMSGAQADEHQQEPLMAQRGKSVVSKSFQSDREVDKTSMAFRKETHYEVRDGGLHVIPPALAYQGKNMDTKWATSSFGRTGLLDVPLEIVCAFRWKYKQTSDPQNKKKGLAYIDLGHRCIRVTQSREGAQLLLENHLVGRESDEGPILLQESSELILEDEKWYDVMIEIKGDEVVFQIDDHVLYGRHPLIAKERYKTFNIDSSGEGFVVDYINVWEAGKLRSDWKATRARLLR